MDILRRYFKHNNFSSFVRQLNTYGFKKVDPDRWEFANEGFLRVQRHLLKNIKRRKSAAASSHCQLPSSNQGFESCVEVGNFGLDAEIDSLRRDKLVLMVELVKLRKQLHNTNLYITQMEQRLKGTELKQKQTMSFLAKVIKNSAFLQQKERIEDILKQKRRKRIDQGEQEQLGHAGIGEESVCIRSELLKEISSFDPDQAMESLDVGEQIIYDGSIGLISDKTIDDGDEVNDVGLWKDLVVGDEDQIVNVFADQMGLLDSCP